MSDKGCLCQQCNKIYAIDLMVDDNLWEKIKPKDKPVGAGLLCPSCIIKNIEGLSTDSFLSFRLGKTKVESVK